MGHVAFQTRCVRVGVSPLTEKPHADAPAPLSAAAPAPAARAARWALKRCFRAAFELAQPAAGAHARDLYWCAELAAPHLPNLAPLLRDALRLYAGLLEPAGGADDSRGPNSGDGGGGGGSSCVGEAAGAGAAVAAPAPTAAAALEEAWRVADALAPALGAEFLREMLRPEPGWLTHHYPSTSGGGGGGWLQWAVGGLLGGGSAGAPAAAAAAVPSVVIPVARQVNASPWSAEALLMHNR